MNCHARQGLRAVRRLAIFMVASVSWIVAAAQAESPDETLDLAAIDAKISEHDRGHWAFQPVARPEPPAVQDNAWCRNPIDQFVLSRLEVKGWRPNPPAAPKSLLRRVYLDLIGMPPPLDVQREFATDHSPDAFDQLVNKLLNRPQYAERWARHWLDQVRYADSNGYERDGAKPNVWRYRDWVIRALMTDMPFDQFVLEQLAGDELPGASPDALIATGYYRLGPWDDEPADPAEDRFEQLDDIINTTSQAFLGLTLACARCHDHKFEPLTRHDYYRLMAVFNGLERPRAGRMELDELVGTPEQIDELRAHEKRIESLKAEVRAAEDAAMAEFFKDNPQELPADVLAAFAKPIIERSPEQNELVRQHEQAFAESFAAWLPTETLQLKLEREKQIAALVASGPKLIRGYFMVEKTTQPRPTHLLIRGKAARPGPQVQPGLPTVLVPTQPDFSVLDQGAATSQRRLKLARWIASPDNPLTARVIVNRVWQFHFGEGLVRTPSDFGVMGEAPTHPKLLDWLADWFVHDAGWSLKKLHRLIMASNTYRMSKGWNAEYGAVDPQTRLLWRVPYRRLEAEAIRDSILAVSGRLNPKLFGPSMFPQVPADALAGSSDPGTVWPAFNEDDASRRTIYAFVKRSLVVPMIDVLDFCDTARTAPQRVVTSVAPQALSLYNGDFVNRQAGYLADRLLVEADADSGSRIDLAYQLALCRPPTDAERTAMQQFLTEQAQQLADEAATAGTPQDERAANYQALVQLCRVIFNLNEFVYCD
ncbi:MAG: DUF1549 and DUF1553 domain-containing protein [Pirellulales bacterium]